jgi:hypothetical protein
MSKDQLTFIKVISGVLIFAGVFLVSRPSAAARSLG